MPSTTLKAPSKKVTRICLVIDRSGSMGSVEKEARDGINEQIAEIKRNATLGGDTFVTYVQFDSEIEAVFSNRPADKLVPITKDEYVPRGMTAMRDAVGFAIETLKEQAKADTDANVGYLIVVISDGAENASRKYSSAALAEQIKSLQDTGNWTFTYMLSNQDLSVATNLGVAAGNVVAYASTGIGTTSGFTKSAGALNSYLNTRSSGLTSTAAFYNQPPAAPAIAPDALATSVGPQLQPTVSVPVSGSNVSTK